MDKWEYQTITADTQEELSEKLNALGAEGWEAISTQHVPPRRIPLLERDPTAYFPGYYEATLKRRKP